jgi:hypothetical protein
MKHLQSLCLTALLAVTLPRVAGAQSSPTNLNPAQLYYQAFLVAPDLSQADSEYLWGTEWQGQQLPERFGKIMASYDNEFRLLRAAARSTVPCDWGIDSSAGPNTLLPHLARAKAAVQTAKFRALWELQHGDQVGAREDILAAFVLGRNASRDGYLISVLVQNACEKLTCWTIAVLFGKFSPESLQQLYDGMQAAPAPRSVADCLATKKALCSDWWLRKIQELRQANPNNDAPVMAGLRQWAGADEATGQHPDGQSDEPNAAWDRISQAAGGTSEGVVRLIQELDSVEARLAPILALPQAEFAAALAPLKAEVERSSNPLLQMDFPAWERARGREPMARMNLAMVRAAIQYKLQGPAGLQTETDPWGTGPFDLQRFVFQGGDRGFELKSACHINGWQEVLIFVEKDGPPFYECGRNAGQPRPKTYPK